LSLGLLLAASLLLGCCWLPLCLAACLLVCWLAAWLLAACWLLESNKKRERPRALLFALALPAWLGLLGLALPLAS
jgi:hypothetical protein